MKALRAMAALAGAAAGIAWLAAHGVTAGGIAGAAGLTLLGASFIPQGLWKGYWVEAAAVLGACVAIMDPVGLLPGAVLMAPLVFFLTVKAWHKLQVSISRAGGEP